MMIGLDSLFIGGYSFSLNWGIMGAAWSSLLVEAILFLLGFGALLYHLHIPVSFWLKPPLLPNFHILRHAKDLFAVRKLMRAALILVGGILLLWGVLWFSKDRILLFFSNDPGLISIAKQALSLLFIPYMLMAINMTLDSLFYGLGKTQYLAYQAILTNGTVYLGAYICYALGIWIPDFSGVMLLFGLGILVDSLLTVYFVRRVLRKTE